MHRRSSGGYTWIVLIGILLLSQFLVSCNNRYDSVRSERSATVDKTPTINVAVVWDTKVSDFLLVEGVRLAAEQVNASGGVLGRKIRLSVYHPKDNADEQEIAKKIAKDPAIAAVIGHRLSTNAIPASITYEYYGLLFLSPSSSNNNLTDHSFTYTFRTLPSDRAVSDRVALYLKSQGHRRIAVIDDRGVYGKGLADGVVESLSDLDLQTVVRRHYTPGKRDYKRLCAELARSEFDALFLGGTLPDAALFIREARQMGVKQRIYGGAALDSEELERIAGPAAHGTVIPTSYHPDLDQPDTAGFIRAFEQRYGRQPDARAATGYDSLNLLVEAMKRGGSADPTVVASNMRFITNWQGATGTFTFNLHGDLVNKEVYFKYLNRKKFIYFDTPTAEEVEPDIAPDP